ncbi:cation transporter [Planococcus lenghuensis]|uniref:HMA domain-containing protein n=1 Tax=Planococcus lenghuensis TaxID=2213202 RepID=A0A1Q2L4M5_9BACL|nr:heavy metal-associated domain-containing protein [Planococcus lenghuensis]AQQ55400.1 hypothetical protein B0X71_19725 [Planococcus lenghuensis]
MKKLVGVVGIALFAGIIIYMTTSNTMTAGNPFAEQNEEPIEVNAVSEENIELPEDETALKETADQEKIVLSGLGMTCSSCEYAVSSGLKNTEGITDFTINGPEDSATVVFDPGQVTVDEIEQAVADVGYEAEEVTEAE